MKTAIKNYGEYDPMEVTNDQYLEEMYAGHEGNVMVCSFVGDPAQGNWSAQAYEPGATIWNPTANNYGVLSTFSKPSRLQNHHTAMHQVLLDDIIICDGHDGGKVSADQVKLAPTSLVETSYGNAQVIYRLAEPITDEAVASRLQAEIGDKIGIGDGDGSNRYFKLPVGRNGKPARDNWDNQLLVYAPNQVYTLFEICEAFDINLEYVLVGPPVEDVDYTAYPDGGPVVAALAWYREQGNLLKAKQADGGRKYQVVCPWIEEHTDPEDTTGAVVGEPGTSTKVPGFWFKCHHGHCNGTDGNPNRGLKDFMGYCREQGFSESAADGFVDETASKNIAPTDIFEPLTSPCDFPKGILPDKVETAMCDIARSMGTSTAAVGALMMAVGSAVVEDTVIIRINATWEESPRSWLAMLGGVSSLKTPVMKAILAPVAEMDKSQRVANEFNDDDDDEEDNRRVRRRLHDDLTPEAAVQQMELGKILVRNDELARWINSFDRYDKATSGRAFWLESYNGGEYNLTRKTSASSYVEKNSAVVIGGMQPEVLAKIASGLSDDGLYQRFNQVVLPEPHLGTDEETKRAASIWADCVYGLSTHVNETYTLSDDANVAFRAFRERLFAIAQAEQLTCASLAAWAGKWHGQLLRTALVLHLMRHSVVDDQTVIDVDVIEAAIRLFEEFYLLHAFVGFTLIGRSSNQLAKAFAGHLLANKMEHFTASYPKRNCHACRGASEREMDAMLAELQAFGWIGPHSAKKKRRDVNPRIYTDFAERAAQEEVTRKALRAKILKETGE